MSVDEDRKLFVAGLGEAATEDTLRRVFLDAGFSTVEVSLPRDRATGRARGFCFVSLETKEQAEAALQQLDGIIVDGRPISVRVFRADRNKGPLRPGDSRGGPLGPRSGDPRTSSQSFRPPLGSRPPGGARPGSNDDSTVYVGNLPFDAVEEDITQFFKDAGFETVRRVHLPVDQDGRRRGFGFVTLADEEAAKGAAETLDGRSFRGRNLGVNLARRGGGAGGGAGHGGPPRQNRPPPRSSYEPPATDRSGGPGGSSDSLPRQEEPWRAKKEHRKDSAAKKKKGRGLTSERPGAPKQRRKNEEFHSSRASDYIDDWDDD